MLLGILLTLQVPAVQTLLARTVSGKLQSMFDGKVEIGSIQIHPVSAITLHDVVLLDDEPYIKDTLGLGFAPVDTVARIGRLSATVSIKQLFHRKGICLGRVEAEDLLFQLVTEPRTKYGNNLSRVLKLGHSDKESKMSMDSLFSINRLHVKGARFRMLNYGSKSNPRCGINFGDMDVCIHSVKAHSLGFYGGRMHATVDELKAEEKSGLKLLNLTGSCAVGMGQTRLNNIRLKEAGGTDLYLPLSILSYENTASWSDFIHMVNIDVRFAPSTLVFQFISNFSGGVFRDCPFTALIKGGRFNGTLSDFTVSDFTLETPYGPYGVVGARMWGLPNIQETSLDATIDGIHFTSAGLSAALADLGANVSLQKLAPGVQFTLRGNAAGPMNRLRSNARIVSEIGSVAAQALLLETVNPKKPIELEASVKADELNLGRLLSAESLGSTSVSANASGVLGGGTTIKLHEMEIEKLGALGYDYHDLHLSGVLSGSEISASFISNDPNARLSLDGDWDLKGKNGQLIADLPYVDLQAIQLDKRGGKSLVSCSISGDQGRNENAPAHVMVSNLILQNDGGTYNIGDIEAEARIADGKLVALLNSGFMDAKYYGPANIGSLVKYAKSVSVERDLPGFFIPDGKEAEPCDATFSAIFHDTRDLLAFVLPSAYIAPDTEMNIDLANDGTLLGYINVPSMRYNKMQADNFQLALDNMDGTSTCTVNSKVLQLGSLSFDRATVNLDADDNWVDLGVNYEGVDLLEQGSELYLKTLLGRDPLGRPVVDIFTQPSFLRIKSDVWSLNESSIKMHGGEIMVDDFRLASEHQSIMLNGSVSPWSNEEMQVNLRNVDLSLLNEFMKESFPDFDGVVNGNATLISPIPSEFGLVADLNVSDLTIDGLYAGDYTLRSNWEDRTKRIRVNLDNKVYHKETTLSASGSYGVKDKSLDGLVLFDNFNIGVAAPFVKEILTELSGKISGTVKAGGTLQHPELKSDALNLDKVRTRIYYTNVAYTLDGNVGLDEDGLKFRQIHVTDDYGGTGVLSGGIKFHELKDFRMDASLRMRRLKAIDIPDPESPIMVYGDLSLSGRGNITGPFNDLHVDADVATSGSGDVNVPLSSSATAKSGSNLLTFTEPVSLDNDSAQNGGTARERRKSKFSAHATVNLSSDVTAHVEIDKESGHVLTAGGNGIVVVDLNTAMDQLNLKGDYNIDKGKYLFNIPGVVSKEFDIKSGSSLQFNGKVIESTMDVKAVHNVKTSLSSLVSSADSSAVSTRRNVECGINITGKISNPDVSFSIDVPDLDPNTKMLVESALNTEDKIQKQFVALLLFGTFLPEDGSGVVNGTNMIASNVGEIVSSQLNNILQKLNIPLDFGLGYQQDKGGTDIFDVAVSTQLFNNRVIVNGSVGNRKFSTSKSSSGDLVGDIDIEIKVDNSGELRFKLFSHSADEFSSSLDFSQRNGLGVSYQKEFDSTREFIRQLFMSKEKKTQEMMRASMRRRETKTIDLEK